MYNEKERERDKKEKERERRAVFHSRAECSTSLCVAIELCYDDRSYVDFVFESPGLRLTSLANSGIHHKHNVVRILVSVSVWGGRWGERKRERERVKEKDREGGGSEGWRGRYMYKCSNRERYSQNIIMGQ